MRLIVCLFISLSFIYPAVAVQSSVTPNIKGLAKYFYAAGSWPVASSWPEARYTMGCFLPLIQREASYLWWDTRTILWGSHAGYRKQLTQGWFDQPWWWGVYVGYDVMSDIQGDMITIRKLRLNPFLDYPTRLTGGFEISAARWGQLTINLYGRWYDPKPSRYVRDYAGISSKVTFNHLPLLSTTRIKPFIGGAVSWIGLPSRSNNKFGVERFPSFILGIRGFVNRWLDLEAQYIYDHQGGQSPFSIGLQIKWGLGNHTHHSVDSLFHHLPNSYIPHYAHSKRLMTVSRLVYTDSRVDKVYVDKPQSTPEEKDKVLNAILKRDLQGMRSLVSEGINIGNVYVNDGDKILEKNRGIWDYSGTGGSLSLIRLIAQTGDISLMEFLEESGISLPFIRNHNLDTFLHFAASYGHEEMVQYLLQRGARLTLNRYKETALHRAAAFGQAASLHRLIIEQARRDEDIGWLRTCNIHCYSAADLAILHGRIGCFKALILAGGSLATFLELFPWLYDIYLRREYKMLGGGGVEPSILSSIQARVTRPLNSHISEYLLDLRDRDGVYYAPIPIEPTPGAHKWIEASVLQLLQAEIDKYKIEDDLFPKDKNKITAWRFASPACKKR
jgi:hypothetical protein